LKKITTVLLKIVVLSNLDSDQSHFYSNSLCYRNTVDSELPSTKAQ